MKEDYNILIIITIWMASLVLIVAVGNFLFHQKLLMNCLKEYTVYECEKIFNPKPI